MAESSVGLGKFFGRGKTQTDSPEDDRDLDP